MQVAVSDLGLQRLYVLHAGSRSFPLGPKMQAIALQRVLLDLEPLG
jgi:hypothetical protein